MIDIEKLREYYMRDLVFVTEHASERYRQRGIKARDVRNVVQTGEIIEQYPDEDKWSDDFRIRKETV